MAKREKQVLMRLIDYVARDMAKNDSEMYFRNERDAWDGFCEAYDAMCHAMGIENWTDFTKREVIKTLENEGFCIDR